MRTSRVRESVHHARQAKVGTRFGELEEDGSFALVIGDPRLEVRGVLPIAPVDKGSIHYYEELSALQEAWEACVCTFPDSGDEGSANKMEAARADIWT